MKKVFVSMIVIVILSTIVSCETEPVIFTIAPSSHDFGQVNIGSTATFDFVLTNKKSVNMTLTTIGFQTGEFSEITGAQGQIIVAKGALAITVQFAPALPGGAKEDTMHLEWTDINGKTGTKNVKLRGEAVPVPIINVSASNYDFGTVGIGQTATHNFNIENTGTADLILSLFNFNGNATLFSISAGGTVPITVIPGATHTVTVQFAPIATGDFPTILEITHNAVNAVPPAQININAAGGGGRIEVNQPSPWDLGTAPVGASNSDDIEISNTGSINLNISNIYLTTGTEFTIESIEDSSGNPIAAPFGIAVGDFVVLTIKFEPSDVQQFNDTLSIDNDGSYAASPLDVELEGTGRALITQTFNYTGAAQQWNVPAGYNQVKVECWGGEGKSTGMGVGGKGGYATANVPVNPGSTINVYVGGASTGWQGGWNGGGNGYSGNNSAGGGGASDIRIGGTALTNRKVVGGAGGGGSATGSYTVAVGGGGGGLNGVNGAVATGGTQTEGGQPNGSGGTAGTFGVGGNGRGNTLASSGGGGGWYGGAGAGASHGGGGGGSSYYDASGNTDKSTDSAVQSGNGKVEISY